MNRSLAKAYGLRLPGPLARIFGPPPLVGDEDPQLYKELFSLLADEYRPNDIVAWLLVKDLADLHWERLRERRLKAEVIKIYQEQPAEESDRPITFVMNLLRIDGFSLIGKRPGRCSKTAILFCVKRKNGLAMQSKCCARFRTGNLFDCAILPRNTQKHGSET